MLFRPLLPSTVFLAEMTPADADPARLMSAEARSVQSAVEKRRREFAAGRMLARDVFARMPHGAAFDAEPLLNDSDRVPIWPNGIVGSITHCRSLCAVAAVAAIHSAGIGLDVEPAHALKDELVPYIVRTTEYARLEALPIDAHALGPILVFAMKEAVYKAIYPIRRRFLDFQDVEIVRLDLAHVAAVLGGQNDRASHADDLLGDFDAEVLVADAAIQGLARISGRFRIADGHIAAAVVLPPAS